MNADLQREYGVRLSDMYEGRISVLDISDFAAHLRRGSAVYEWYGGWTAVTPEVEAMMRLEYLLHAQIIQAAGKKRSIPEPKPPVSLRDVVKQEISKRERLARVRADAANYRK